MSYSAYNQPLTLDELRAYRAGTLNAAQQHRIERLLLENPLYADALEGLDAIQQAGSSLQRQTKSLHEALQERIHEAATPRRLMPLWVTSLAASVLLVLSVTFYLIYTTNSVGTASRKGSSPAITNVVQPQPEPGTVLLNIKDLGSAEMAFSTKKSTPAALLAKRSSQKTGYRRGAKKQVQPASVVDQVQDVVATAAATTSMATLPTDPHLSATAAEEQQAVRRARTVNPERAFTDWPPAVKL